MQFSFFFMSPCSKLQHFIPAFASLIHSTPGFIPFHVYFHQFSYFFLAFAASRHSTHSSLRCLTPSDSFKTLSSNFQSLSCVSLTIFTFFADTRTRKTFRTVSFVCKVSPAVFAFLVMHLPPLDIQHIVTIIPGVFPTFNTQLHASSCVFPGVSQFSHSFHRT